MNNWLQLDQTYLMSTYQRLPVAIEKAKGNYLYDTEGNKYLDLFTGLAVNTLGHGHPKIKEALYTQAEKFLHISNVFLNPPAIQLAKRLIHYTVQDGKVFFTNSGAEATDSLIKLVFKWAEKKQNDKAGIIVVSNSFHGRTLGALRYTRQKNVYQNFPVLDYPLFEVEANNIDQVKAICKQKNPAAILIEPILGSGGVVSYTSNYLQEVQTICEQNQMLFCIDEIQTGMGRTGELFAYQHDELQPDLILFAKGIGGGLPLGGVIAGEQCKNIFQPGDHGTTFAPSPLSAALGNAMLDVLIEEQLLEKSQANIQYLWDQLQNLQINFPQIIQQIDGKGMMIGIKMNSSAHETNQLQRSLFKQGILVNITARHTIRLLPPLTLTKTEIDDFIQKTTKIFTSLS